MGKKKAQPEPPPETEAQSVKAHITQSVNELELYCELLEESVTRLRTVVQIMQQLEIAELEIYNVKSMRDGCGKVKRFATVALETAEKSKYKALLEE